MNNCQKVFFELVKAGLWEKDVLLLKYGEIDFKEVYRLAEEQSVVGLVAAGLEHIKDRKVPKQDVLHVISKTLQLEQRNTAMNYCIGILVEKMRKDGIYTLLVKGQGVAQCYERPLWRASGDVDFYLSKDNYDKAKSFFRPLVKSFDPDNDNAEHINMQYDSWVVEIHVNQHCSLSTRINRGLDEIHNDLFLHGNVKRVYIGDTMVFMPSPDNDVLILFTHYVKHFFKGGLGIRQICDWSRLLWTYKDSIDHLLLNQRLRKMGLLRIWKSFAVFAVEYLGLPKDAMPFYEESARLRKNADRICSFVLEVGNFGHNRNNSYYRKYPRLFSKMISLARRFGDAAKHLRIFPLDTLIIFPGIVYYGAKSTIKGA